MAHCCICTRTNQYTSVCPRVQSSKAHLPRLLIDPRDLPGRHLLAPSVGRFGDYRDWPYLNVLPLCKNSTHGSWASLKRAPRLLRTQINSQIHPLFGVVPQYSGPQTAAISQLRFVFAGRDYAHSDTTSDNDFSGKTILTYHGTRDTRTVQKSESH